ncbi:MAG: hypothetical protein FWF38_00445 [Spirochaetaceae bacterium]|nr:hypothetical protein [Spirochaetaceae bacterium]
MFSNGTEAMIWMGNNCERCWKYDPTKDYDKSRCKIEASISIGFVDGKLSKRVDRITEMKDCPYRQEKRPAYKRKARDEKTLLLFA